MKKILPLSSFILILLGSISGCSGNKETHTHTFYETYEKDELKHWHAASCEHSDLISGLENHNFVDNVCTICGYKKETKKQFVVTYITNCDETISPLIVEEGSYIQKPKEISNPDNCFLGWYESSNFEGEPYSFNEQINDNLTLHALWGVKITYYDHDREIYKEEKLRINEYVIEPTIPTYNNLHFLGWFNNGSFSGEAFEFNVPISKNISLYACFGYEVKFLSYEKTILETKYIKENDILLKPNDPSKDYYDFNNWYIDSNFTTPYSFGEKLTQDLTLYSKFTPKKYNITYHNADGLIHDNPNVYTYGVGLEQFALPSDDEFKDVSKFYGWYLDEEFTQPATNISSASHEDINVYAKRANYHTITYSNWPEDIPNTNQTKFTIYDDVLFNADEIKKYDGFSNIRFLVDNQAVPGIAHNTNKDIEVVMSYNKVQVSFNLDLNKGNLVRSKPFIYIDYQHIKKEKIYLPTNETSINIFDRELFPIPEDPIYAFAGYYLDANYYERINNQEEITCGQTIYAKYEKKNHDRDNKVIAYRQQGYIENIFDRGNCHARIQLEIPWYAEGLAFEFTSMVPGQHALEIKDVIGEVDICNRIAKDGPYFQANQTFENRNYKDIMFDYSYIGDEICFSVYLTLTINKYINLDFSIVPETEIAIYTIDYWDILNFDTPTRDNHDFLGWYDNNGNKLNLNTRLTLADAEQSYKAKWKTTKGQQLISQLYDEKDYINSLLLESDTFEQNDRLLIVETIDEIILSTSNDLLGDIDYDEALTIYLNVLSVINSEAFAKVKSSIKTFLETLYLNYTILTKKLNDLADAYERALISIDNSESISDALSRCKNAEIEFSSIAID